MPLTAGMAIQIDYTRYRGCTLSPHDVLELHQAQLDPVPTS
jgi:hypothetical protein